LPKVVIVGRPNVGKSSLFNWVAGRKIAIVDDVAGVTRDRIGTLVQLGDDAEARFFELIDTGGVGMVDRDDLSDHVEKQIDAALNEAELILFVVDVREGRMPLDEEVARRLRYVDKPVILVINKADAPELDACGEEFVKLGRGKPVYVSTKQNRNRKVLMDLIASKLPAEGSEKPADETMKVAVVGRPNTGKSTFINTLAHAERMIVSEVPGTTRDSVDVRFELDGLPFVAIDTAGVRRKAKIRDDLDFYSVHRAERSIRRADVVLLFIDPTQGISRLDKQLADYVAQQYKPCVFVINKWDLITANPEGPSVEAMNKVAVGVQHAFRTMAYMPLAFITAKTGKNVKALLNLSQSMFKQAKRRVSTATLNRVLREAVEAHPPAMRENRTPKIYYATQVGTAPPTVVLFVNAPGLFDAPYQRYLLNVFRQKLPFRDIPIKLYLRARTKADPHGAAPRPEDPTADAGPRLDRTRERPVEELDELPSRMDSGPDPELTLASSSDSGIRRLDREVNELLDDMGD
jgi:GTP-binding protein